MTAIVYMAKSSGARSVSVDVGSLRVVVDPLDETNNQAAVELAERIERYEKALREARKLIQGANEERKILKAKLREAGERNLAAITGRRRFFGPVVMVPVPGDAAGWIGPVLLLDPEKLFRGRSLEFASAAEVHREHPELWVIGTFSFESGVTGVVLDAWGRP